MPPYLLPSNQAILLRIKAVPGAAQDAIAGPLGDRLKIRVCAPPEGGKANTAIIKLLASTLGIKRSRITITTGLTSAEKTIQLDGMELEAASRALHRSSSA